MKKRIVLVLPIFLLIIVVASFLYINLNKNINIDFNTDLKVSLKDNKLSSDISKLSSNKYSIKEVSSVEIDSDVEEKIVALAYNITNALNDIDNDKFYENIEKYQLRSPYFKLTDDILSNDNEEYKEWSNINLSSWALASVLADHNYKFEKIDGYNITYASSSRYLVQVYVDNYKGNYGITNVMVDAVYEYEVVYEEVSGLYKVKRINVEWVKDLEDYYQKMDISERKQNKENSTTLSNISNYVPSGYTSINYDKLKAIKDTIPESIYEKNKDSVVIIDSASKEGITTGSAMGFFIRKGIIVTSYDGLYTMIKNGAVRYYAVDNDEKIHNIKGLVTAYPSANLALLKLDEEFGKAVTIGDSSKLKESDPIAVISSSLGLKTSIKLGVYFDTLQDDYKIIRTSLPLIDGDIGSAVFNMNGEVIAINTSVSTSDAKYNSGLNNAIDINILKDVINVLAKESFEKIESISFTDLENENKKTNQNNVPKKIWNKYLKLPLISNYYPLTLYSSYYKNGYLIVRYQQDEYKVLDNDTIVVSYGETLLDNGYKKIGNNLYQKADIKIKVTNNLGFIIITVEGVD